MDGCSQEGRVPSVLEALEKEEGTETCWPVSLLFYLGLNVAPSLCPCKGCTWRNWGAAGVPYHPVVHWAHENNTCDRKPHTQ